MKLLALSDIHGEIGILAKISKKIGQVDLVVITGDLTYFGDRRVDELLAVLGKRNIFAVPGNLDSENTLREMEEKGISLHKRRKEFQGFWFAGFGGGLEGRGGTMNHSEEEILKNLEKIVQGENTVLCTHLPPKETRLDLTHNGEHAGSASVREIIENFKPRLALCGHIHEAAGEEKIGETLCVNAGPAKDGNAVLIELGKEIKSERIKVEE